MKRGIVFTTLAVALFSSAATYAQKVQTTTIDGTVYPVIDCSGMPSSEYSIMPKGNTEAELKTKAANATVYKRFAVAISQTSSRYTAVEAFRVCSGMSDGSWRLPTQRELMLMWILKYQLEQTNGFTPFIGGSHWSATESIEGVGSTWTVESRYGTSAADGKTNPNYVRCIRELTDQPTKINSKKQRR